MQIDKETVVSYDSAMERKQMYYAKMKWYTGSKIHYVRSIGVQDSLEDSPDCAVFLSWGKHTIGGITLIVDL